MQTVHTEYNEVDNRKVNRWDLRNTVTRPLLNQDIIKHTSP